MLKLENIHAINMEISSRCAARCPFCSRGQKVREYGNHDISLAVFQRLPGTLLARLKRISFSGNFGDFSSNPEFVDIVTHVTQLNPGVAMDGETNGFLQREAWWRRLGEVFGVGGLTFALDGLADTHGLHRRGIDFDRVVRNMTAFISGGGHAYWKFIVFEHNAHQIAAAESLARDVGCHGFSVVSSREYTEALRPPQHLDVHIKRDVYREYLDKLSIHERRAQCKPFHEGSVYIAADGTVHPCCFAHCMYVTEHNRSFAYIVPLIDRFHDQINFKTRDLGDIVAGPYFRSVERQSATNAYCMLKCNRFKKTIRGKLILYEANLRG